MSFFRELKRRNVFRVGAAYVVVAWLIMQIVDVVLGNIEAPGWVFQVILLLLAIGFPLSLLIAWVYELTPDGIRKESEVSGSASIIRKTGHRLNYVIIGALVVAVIYLVMLRDRVEDESQSPAENIYARPSVIVLPFTNTSGDDSQDYLSFGITDELITGLQRYKDFPVVPLGASLEYRKTELSADEFTRNIGAAYRVEGSITVVNEDIRVLATLSRVGGSQVWADRFQQNAGTNGLFDLADELVARVASAVLESEIKRLHRADRPPADAWEHYIRGLETVLDFDPDDYEAARYQLDQAVQIAPEMAEAWWALGELEVSNYVSRSNLENTDIEDVYTIIEYFRRSHEISPFYAAACGCLGYMLTVVNQLDEARAVFSQALEANPLSADLRSDYASFLLWDGQYAEAIVNGDLVLKLGASHFDRANVWATRAIVALADGNTTTALEAVNRAMFIDKNIFHMPLAVAMLYTLGDQAAASRLLDEMEQAFPGVSPDNPVLYIMLKPIDDILAKRRERGELDGPANVSEIFSLLREID